MRPWVEIQRLSAAPPKSMIKKSPMGLPTHLKLNGNRVIVVMVTTGMMKTLTTLRKKLGELFHRKVEFIGSSKFELQTKAGIDFINKTSTIKNIHHSRNIITEGRYCLVLTYVKLTKLGLLASSFSSFI